MRKGTSLDAFGGTFGTLIWFVLLALLIIGQWKVNEKAGFPGWYAIIPILNVYTLFKIAGRPGWWVILALIPFVNIVVWALAMIDLSKAFGRSQNFAIGLIFLSGIFLAIIGFGDDRYEGARAGA